MSKFLTERELKEPKECINCGIHSSWRYRKGRGRDCRRCIGKFERNRNKKLKANGGLEGPWSCESCGIFCSTKGFFDADHVLPKSQGGSNDIGNIHLLCPNCHRIKSINDGTMKSWLIDGSENQSKLALII